MLIIGILIGMFIGTCLGVLIAGICISGADADRKKEAILRAILAQQTDKHPAIPEHDAGITG